MAHRAKQTWTWTFTSPPEAIWPLLADTARFNEAAKLPKHEVEERPREDGSVLYLARARIGPFRLEWREKPVNWVTGRWFEHLRVFHNGPLRSLCATFVLSPSDGGGSRGDYTIEVETANPLGRLILAGGFMASAGRNFGALAAQADEFALGERAMPFHYVPPRPSREVYTWLDAMSAQIEASGHGHGLARRLGEHVLTAQEVDLVHMRPLRLAREWNVSERQAVELCLEATRAGLLDLRWTLLCPRCRIGKAEATALDSLPAGAHCSTCNIAYDREFSRNVELSFQPASAIRQVTGGEYCLFGPMSTPHIRLHVTLEPGERRELDAELTPGAYRLRSLEPGPECQIDWHDGGFPEMIFTEGAVQAGPPAPAGCVRLANASERERTLIIEEGAWVGEALTADRVTALQSFRDLFSDEVLRPGDEVAVRRLALMFTDLRGSTRMYTVVGDAAAYHVVRDHFAFLIGAVREQDGAVVKTIGDAVMAVFTDPLAALEAALAVHKRLADFNREHERMPIAIKIGLHAGPCIAVTMNDQLDYFGTTVNVASRLQSESRGGDIVVSAEMASWPPVAERLTGLSAASECLDFKGFDEVIAFLRIRP